MAVNPLQLFPPRVGVYFQHSPLDSGLNLWLSLANRLCCFNTYPLTRHFYLVKEPERTCGGWDHVTEWSHPSWGPYINSPDAGWTWRHGPHGRPADPPPSWAQPQSLAHRLISKYNGGCFKPLSLCIYCYTIDNRYKGLNKWGIIINDMWNTSTKPSHLSICQQIYQPPHGASKLSSTHLGPLQSARQLGKTKTN